MEPIKIGWLGSALDGPGGGYDKIHRLAFDEAAEQGLLDRPVEFVLHPENGLPQGSAKNANASSISTGTTWTRSRTRSRRTVSAATSATVRRIAVSNVCSIYV